jgi:uncharacterized Rmd1/YagE family protein
MKNRFAGLKDVNSIQKSETMSKTNETEQKASNAQETVNQTSKNNSIEAPRRGRPNGKRSNENFRQVTAYIGKDTYRQTKMKLLAAEKPQEFSELIDILLNRWLQEK